MAIKKLRKVFSAGAYITERETPEKINEIIEAVNDITDSSSSFTEVEVGDGTAAAPSVSFTSDSDSGLYRIGANNVGVAVNGAKVLDVATTGLGITGVATVSSTTASTTKDTGALIVEGGVGVEKEIYAGLSINAGTYVTSGNGTVSLPAIGPVSDPDSGLYVIGANNLGVACAGAKVLDIGTTVLGVTGDVISSGRLLLNATPETRTGPGAINTTSAVTLVVTTGANALTLAAGTAGQIKVITMKTDGGDGTLTPTGLRGGTTITFNDVGDTVTLMYIDSAWIILSNFGCTVA